MTYAPSSALIPKDQAAEIDFTNIPKSGLMWSDGMVRVSGREYNGLINSPCFKHDDESNRMTLLVVSFHA